jgi:hypothetical protein
MPGDVDVHVVDARVGGWLIWPNLTATAAFNLATSVLFFHCVNQGLPFYWPRTH